VWTPCAIQSQAYRDIEALVQPPFARLLSISWREIHSSNKDNPGEGAESRNRSRAPDRDKITSTFSPTLPFLPPRVLPPLCSREISLCMFFRGKSRAFAQRVELGGGEEEEEEEEFFNHCL